MANTIETDTPSALESIGENGTKIIIDGNNFKEHVSRYREEISKLHELLEHSSEENEKLKQQYDKENEEQMETCQQLLEKGKLLDAELKEKNATITTLQSRIKELETELHESQTTQKSRVEPKLEESDEIDGLINEYEPSTTPTKKGKGGEEAKEDEDVPMQLRLHRTQVENNQLKREINSLQQQLNEWNDKAGAVDQDLMSFEGGDDMSVCSEDDRSMFNSMLEPVDMLHELTEKAHYLKGENTELKDIINKLQSQLEEAKQTARELEASEANTLRITQQMESLTTALKDKESEMKNQESRHEQKWDDFSKQLIHFNDLYNDIFAKNSDLSEQLRVSTRKEGELAKEISMLNEQMNKTNGQVKDKENDNKELQTKMSQLKSSLADQTNLIAELKQKQLGHKKTTEAMEKKQRQMEETLKINDKLKGDLESFKEMYQTERSRLENMNEKHIEQVNKLLEKIEEQDLLIRQHEETISMLEKEVGNTQALQLEIARYKATTLQLRQQLAKMQRQICELTTWKSKAIRRRQNLYDIAVKEKNNLKTRIDSFANDAFGEEKQQI